MCDIDARSARSVSKVGMVMRKVAALVALLAVVVWTLADGRILSHVACSLELGQGSVARAEPLCPLC